MSSSSESASPVARSTGIVQAMRDHPLVSFFILSYAITWVLQSPWVLSGVPPFNEKAHAPALWMLPSIAIGVTGTAFVMTALTQGRAGVRRLLQRLTWWRVGLRWYAVAVLLIPLSALVIAAVVLGTPGGLRALFPSALLLYPAAYLAHFFFGPLFEETGWRGYALPRMQHRFGPLMGTLYLGLLWSGWHYFAYAPQWLGSGSAVVGLVNLGTFTVLTTSMAFVFTWLSNNTQASLLLCILLHGSVDGSTTYFQVLADGGIISAKTAANITGTGMLLACVVLAVLLVVVTRGRLSYPRYEREAEPLDLRPSMEQNGRGLGHDGERSYTG